MSRVIVFHYVYENFLWFKGGKASPTYFSDMKTWFYHGFTKRHQLSYTRVAGASRKLPNDWRDKMRHIIEHITNSQQWRHAGRNAVPPVLDKYFVNTDHLPFYRNISGMYS